MSIATLLDMFRPRASAPALQPARPPITPPPTPQVKTGPWRDWYAILVACGVSMGVASKWEAAFRNRVTPDTFDEAQSAHFLGQCLHETSMFTKLQEALHYSAERMMAVWPRRFPDIASTVGLVMNPRALAERVYGGRMGNDLPGDGFAYRGRGFPMITGKDNYEALQTETGIPLVDFPDLLLTPDNALICGLAWWRANVRDADTVEAVTQIVNGGQTGLEERRRLTAVAQRALASNPWR